MIQVYSLEQFKRAFKERKSELEEVTDGVREIIRDVRERGDAAVRDYEQRFSDSVLSDLFVSKREIEDAEKQISPTLLKALKQAANNIFEYHKRQVETGKEHACKRGSTGWVMRPVRRAGIYVPGGTAAYPSSVLMTALAAQAAGVSEICMTTPASHGSIHPLTLTAAKMCGVTEIYKAGGAQAIAALAYGTQTMRRVDVIAGPGNLYVTAAKKLVYGDVGIDMLAGPSEILIIADGSAKAEFIAADMLSQAEHDQKAAAYLVTDSETLAGCVRRELEEQIAKLKRKDIARAAIDGRSCIVNVANLEEAVSVSNEIAPEHLELCMRNAREYLPQIQNAGAVFLGHYSPEPLGDYFAGPNHVLPTGGSARFFSVLSATTFLKRISVIEYGREALESAAESIIALAESEGLTGHAESVRVRVDAKKAK